MSGKLGEKKVSYVPDRDKMQTMTYRKHEDKLKQHLADRINSKNARQRVHSVQSKEHERSKDDRATRSGTRESAQKYQ